MAYVIEVQVRLRPEDYGRGGMMEFRGEIKLEADDFGAVAEIFARFHAFHESLARHKEPAVGVPVT